MNYIRFLYHRSYELLLLSLSDLDNLHRGEFLFSRLATISSEEKEKRCVYCSRTVFY